MIRHVVFMKFKPETSEASIPEVEMHLGRLPGLIPDILAYEFGRDIVRSERSYDFALISSFNDLEALRRYQVHPDHLVVVDLLKGICERLVAVDFEM